MEEVRSNGGYDAVVISGDCNFSNLVWDQKVIKYDLSLSKHQKNFATLMNNYNLFNEVTNLTRKNNLLDLVMTNVASLVRKWTIW